jgi:hypothetical protein
MKRASTVVDVDQIRGQIAVLNRDVQQTSKAPSLILFKRNKLFASIRPRAVVMRCDAPEQVHGLPGLLRRYQQGNFVIPV